MKRIVAHNGVVFYRSEQIPCTHGFATRIGGVSVLPHTSSLNLGVDRGDPLSVVQKNLSLLGEAVGFEAEQVISVSQIHSTHLRYVTEREAGEGYFTSETESCDGYVTDRRGIVLGVRTADCVPILLYAPPNETGFSGGVSAVHAGWRGTAGGMVCRAVERLCSLGARLDQITVAIGPAIGPCCYEVRSDFYQQFLSLAGRELTDRFVLPHQEKEGVWMADLSAVNQAMLTKMGIHPERIDCSDRCTCCHPEEFFSHRYSGGIRGTMLSVISLG